VMGSAPITGDQIESKFVKIPSYRERSKNPLLTQNQYAYCLIEYSVTTDKSRSHVTSYYLNSLWRFDSRRNFADQFLHDQCMKQ
jgi:hypothetical protein